MIIERFSVICDKIFLTCHFDFALDIPKFEILCFIKYQFGGMIYYTCFILRKMTILLKYFAKLLYVCVVE